MSQIPFITVIIPARNESAFIEETLRAAALQTYPQDLYEILVADGNSTDDTRQKITQFAARHKTPRIEVLNNPKQTMPSGFNLALGAAKGEIIIMMSAHANMAEDYLEQCADFLSQHLEASCVGGAITTLSQDKKSKVIALAMSSIFGVGNSSFRTGLNATAKTDSAVFAAYRRGVFEKIGGLDEEMIRNQDDEFNYRLREYGGEIYSTPKIRSFYYSRATLGGLWKQYFQYGFYKVRVLQKHPRQMSLRQFVPPLFVLALLFSSLLSILPATRSLSLVVPAAYLLANLAASLMTAYKNKILFRPSFFILPIAFAILHISYGLGFLAGLFKFWNRWGDKNGKTPSIEPLP